MERWGVGRGVHEIDQNGQIAQIKWNRMQAETNWLSYGLDTSLRLRQRLCRLSSLSTFVPLISRLWKQNNNNGVGCIINELGTLPSVRLSITQILVWPILGVVRHSMNEPSKSILINHFVVTSGHLYKLFYCFLSFYCSIIFFRYSNWFLVSNRMQVMTQP